MKFQHTRCRLLEHSLTWTYRLPYQKEREIRRRPLWTYHTVKRRRPLECALPPQSQESVPPLVSSVAEGQIYGTGHVNQNTLTSTEGTFYINISLSKIQAVLHGTRFSYYERVKHAVTMVLLRYTWQGDVFRISVSTLQLKQMTPYNMKVLSVTSSLRGAGAIQNFGILDS